MKSIIVIPARLHSTRLPQKLLLAETGKPLVQHTYEAAMQASKPAEVVVATDHQDIFDVVTRFGGNVVITDPNHASGTDRVAEVAQAFPEVDVFVNVQGDEPEISAEAIDLSIELLEKDGAAVMSTLATKIRSKVQLEDPACVKVITNARSQAIYFSRSVIPHPRTWDDALLTDPDGPFLQHIGLYAYRRDFLNQISNLPRPSIEKIESLEQLRVLHAGFQISVGVIEEPTVGIDTAEDYAAFVGRYT